MFYFYKKKPDQSCLNFKLINPKLNNTLTIINSCFYNTYSVPLAKNLSDLPIIFLMSFLTISIAIEFRYQGSHNANVEDNNESTRESLQLLLLQAEWQILFHPIKQTEKDKQYYMLAPTEAPKPQCKRPFSLGTAFLKL